MRTIFSNWSLRPRWALRALLPHRQGDWPGQCIERAFPSTVKILKCAAGIIDASSGSLHPRGPRRTLYSLDSLVSRVTPYSRMAPVSVRTRRSWDTDRSGGPPLSGKAQTYLS